MTWAELEWPDLSRELPEPVVTRAAPVRPDVPAEIGERVRAAERRRAVGVRVCVLVGAALCCAAFVVYAAYMRGGGGGGEAGGAPAVMLALLAAGLVVAFPVAALAALRLGPTWEQRRQHWRYLHWREEYGRWLGVQRSVYVDSLSREQRALLARRLGEPGGGPDGKEAVE